MKNLRWLVVVALLGACSDPFVAPATRLYKAVATGGEHTCALATDGSAYCWGRGLDGELGTGSKENRITATAVTGNLRFNDITTGDEHTCALTTDGTAYCWGWNSFYQRGNPDDPTEAAPVKVVTELRFRAITAGAQHTCALTADSLAYCWGYNRYGQAGNGATNTVITPSPVQGAIKFNQISAGGNHTCGVGRSGQLYCWGSNESGELGIGTTVLLSSSPAALTSSLVFQQVDAGTTHTCGVTNTNQFLCWGSDNHGELGRGSAFKNGLPGAYSPEQLNSLWPVGVSISAGSEHTCAIGPNKDTRCWGHGEFLQLANGATADQFVPQPVHLQPGDNNNGDLLQFTVIATGGWTHACGVADQSVFCWGTGSSGQLGVASTRIAPLPQRISD